MQSFELEEMALFLIRDADEAEMWIDRWAVSYPIVQTAEADSRQTISEWQHAIQTAFDHIVSRNIAVVAHGAGVSAFLAWLYQTDILTQKRLTKYYFSLAASRSFSRGRNPYVPTRPLSLPYGVGYRRNKRYATRLGARTGRPLACTPASIAAFRPVKRRTRRLAMGHEADAGNAVE